MGLKDCYSVISIDSFLCKEWIMKKHYAKRMPVIMFSFGLFDSEKMVGIITFGPVASSNSQYICGENYRKHVIELNRLITNDELQKNVHSFFISKCLSLLPKPMVVISFADPNAGHNGYVYQASNFIYTGRITEQYLFTFNGRNYSTRKIEKNWFKIRGLSFNEHDTIADNFRRHGGIIQKIERKHRYVYIHASKKEKRHIRGLLKYEEKPFPKGDNKKYDASYKTLNQYQLFR